MDRDSVKELLREVVGPNTELVDHPNWVGLRCPMAPWTHESGKDSSPSAGISVKEDGTSIYNCYVCGKGTVSWFLKQMEKYTGESYKHLIRNVEDGEFLGGALPEWGGRKLAGKQTLKTLDREQYLDLYDSAEGHWYFCDRAKKRGETCINDDTVRAMHLLVDPADSQGDERILFPVFGRGGELYGFSGRAVYEQAELKVRDYHGLPKSKVLLGLDLVQPDDKFVVVVEGLIDTAMLVQYNYPVVGVLHSGLTEYQAQLLVDLGLPAILMYDNDEAGYKGTDVAIEMLKNYLPLSRVRYPKRKGKGGKGATCPKDPAGCTRKEVDWMIAKASIV